ncbi:MAG: class I SAM-dependent methyltransferase [Candidatus Thermoplasmatota archaeon]|nr:class I SAM-dependent methyltransferase [Candidatus Thermoplasmatota archaeon]
MMDANGMSGRHWTEVVEALEEIAPDYDRVNQLITFGLADRWRREVAAYAEPDDVVLEVGSGPGSFARHLISKSIYCIEPSGELANYSKELLDQNRIQLVRAVGEKIPMADQSVDKVFCVFSFRDFFDKGEGISEIHRVLKAGGEVRIVDVAKPPPGPLAKLLDMHVKHIVPRLARIAVNPASYHRLKRDPYMTFVDTYKAFGFTSIYENLLSQQGFSEVKTEFLKMKGATMTRGKKPWTSTS